MSLEMMAKVYAEAKARLEKAFEVARAYGEVVGHVSRLASSIISEEEPMVQFDVDPYVYFENYEYVATAGSYLAVVDIKACEVISLRVRRVERRDLMSEIGVPETTGLPPRLDAAGLITRARVLAEPLLAWSPETGEVKAANYVIEPQSPVIKPRPEILAKILGLPEEGVNIGVLTIGEKPLHNVVVKLPLKAFYQHVLVLGTTGSGKTTFVKNLIASLLSSTYSDPSDMPTVVVVDSTKDYVHMVLERRWECSSGVNVSQEEQIASLLVGGYDGPREAVILVPVTRLLVDRLVEYWERRGGGQLRTGSEALEALAYYYYEANYRRLIEGLLEGVEEEVNVKVEGYQPRRVAVLSFTYRSPKGSRSVKLTIVPYAFRFTSVKGRALAELNPFLTSQARDQLPRIISAIERSGVKLTTLHSLLEVLRGCLTRRPEYAELSNLILKGLGVHSRTVENIVRTLGVLEDSGIFDVVVGGEMLEEPDMGWLLESSPGKLIIVDLEFLREHTPMMAGNAENIVALRVLNRCFTWKMRKYASRERTQPVIVIVDEAHRFFPAAGGGEGEYVLQVSNMLAHIARLGRARRMGLIFATHSPKDVHEIVLQLTNTKVIFRVDPALVEKLELPATYKSLVPRLGDRVAVLKTHMLRLGYATIKTPLPITGHFDLSAL